MMEQQKSFLEVVDAEKQLLAMIHTKGILHDDILVLYCQIRSVYEKILLSSNHSVELQEVEHHMWKLHYELIDEFRKRTRQRSCNGENAKNNTPSDNIHSQTQCNKALQEFKSFLSQATEFYRNLIVKLRRACGLPAQVFLNSKDRWPSSVDPMKLHACQHTCHRLLICLGDLARYSELAKKPDACEWSTAAMFYLEATRTWPDSGNPHNQLALLATYTGDAFLALYHCIRSLSVKEPFPDAWRNIMLLFEENRSTKLPSLSIQMHLDFLNPSKRSYLQNACLDENGSPHNSTSEDLDSICSEKFDLWPILVRTISFLLIRSSLEEYPCTLASALHKLDALLAVDDTRIAAALEAYQHMDSSRRGPYRVIQVVSIFIFIVHTLTESLPHEDSTGKDDQKHAALTPLAFAGIFIFMGRLTERCLTGDQTDVSPLLPAVLVFVEWLAGALDTVETYDADERVRNAICYFFAALVDLWDRIEKTVEGTAVLDHSALWEDHELRGFYPLHRVHELLDFTTHLESADSYTSRNECRLSRIIRAAKRIADTSKSSLEWIFQDKVGTLLSESEKTSNFPEQEEVESAASSVSNDEVERPNEQEDKLSLKSFEKSVPVEEEEVILFKPITRRNSAPPYISKPAKDPVSPDDEHQPPTASADDWLRRATSLSTTQDMEDADSFSFCSTISDPGDDRSLKHRGPPSLSGWVLSRANSSTERDFSKQKLSPIDETASTSFNGLSINETKDSEVRTGHLSTIVHDSIPYVTPIPSAPMLPDDASWMKGNSIVSPEYKSAAAGHEADGILGAAPMSGYASRSPLCPPTGLSGFVDGYPLLHGMSSSEWLYHYRNSQNSSPFRTPVFGNLQMHELSSFDLCDQWGNRLVSNPMLYWGTPEVHQSSSLAYAVEEQKRDKVLGYQRTFPYVCGAGMELSSEQPPLLQYLKEKERQLQPGSQLRGPSFMGN